jgi:MerC mercury resistance protein
MSVRTERLDTAGTMASLLCAVHCALLPLAIQLLPNLGLALLADKMLERALLGLSAALGVGSLCRGYRVHRSRRALSVLAVGLTLAVWGRILEERASGPWGVPLLVAGGLVLAAAHTLNRALCRACPRCR